MGAKQLAGLEHLPPGQLAEHESTPFGVTRHNHRFLPTTQS
jgi:hypothetical protein